MEQVRKIVEVGCKEIVKDSLALAEMVTREKKEIYLVHDKDYPMYSFLMITSDKNYKKNNYKNLGCYSSAIEGTDNTRLKGVFSVKKHHNGGYEAIYLWSISAIEATILYSLGLRVWKKIVSNRGDSRSVNSVLDKLKKIDGNNHNNEYVVRKEMEMLPYECDVKIVSLEASQHLKKQYCESTYNIAERISQTNREMYFTHDATFDEMHRIANLIGLKLISQ